MNKPESSSSYDSSFPFDKQLFWHEKKKKNPNLPLTFLHLVQSTTTTLNSHINKFQEKGEEIL